MKPIKRFLKETVSQYGGMRGGGLGIRGQSGRTNAPTMAWETVHGKKYPSGLKPSHTMGAQEKLWKGIPVDVELQDKWLNELNRIPNVEIRSSCQGHPPIGENPSFLIFRPKDEHRAKLIVNKLSDNKITFCSFNIGTQGHVRICVATPLYANGPKDKLWEQWWDTLAKRIDKAVNK